MNHEKFQKQLKMKNKRIVSDILRNIVIMECPKNHQYKSHVRSIFKKACTTCRKNFNILNRRKLEEERRKREYEEGQRQQRLFAEAKRNV